MTDDTICTYSDDQLLRTFFESMSVHVDWCALRGCFMSVAVWIGLQAV